MKYNEYKQSVTELCTYAGAHILEFWQQNAIFQKSVAGREGQPGFVFYEGPPSANGTPGIHHVMARTVKDLFCRYQTLKGRQVQRKGGWDTHGLPVELQVEKELGITKDAIGKKISIAEYNQKCREAVMKYKSQWDDLTERIGYWVDLDKPYLTFDNDYIESCWWLLAELYKKDLLYKWYTIQPYSPAAGTGLSSHELNQPDTYKNVKDTSIIAQFKLKGGNNEYFLAWTTTPWTLPANTMLIVGKDITYIKVKTHNQYTNQPVNAIFAKERLDYVLGGKYVNRNDFDEAKHSGKIPYIIMEEFPGEELIGLEYEQLMPYVQPRQDADKAFRVYAGDFVTTEDGTGIVHGAPTFGADDYRVAKQHGVPAITVPDENGNEVPIVDKRGRFVAQIGEFGGRYVKEQYYSDQEQAALDFKPTDVLIAIKLKEENKAFKVEKYEHTYPHCWRTDKPILYYPLESWFVRTTALKHRLVALNQTINWKPGSTGSGRFGNWLENLVDWNLSRSRFWGTPLPIWRTEDGREEVCIGSVAQLKAAIEEALTRGQAALTPAQKDQNNAIYRQFGQPGFDLHRPHVDHITLLSPSGKPMFREPDLIDVWFDSGAMPYAQFHFPFEHAGDYPDGMANLRPQAGQLGKVYPADFISEGVDQTRGWFFTLHALAGLLFDSVAFKNVVSTGLVLDANGNKMSKRLGNVVNPFDTLDRYGADAVRWYMITNASPWDNLKFSLDGLQDMQRKFFGTLQNTYNFFALYANIDGFTYQQAEVPLSERTESDRWIISRLHSLAQLVDRAYADYDATPATRAIQNFVNDDLSNWYVRLNRKRFWKGELTTDKLAAYQTLYTCLATVAKLASPVAPFYCDLLYRDLNLVTGREAAESVHLTEFPVGTPGLMDPELEEKMALAQTICSLVHSVRKEQKLRVRQPLQKISIPSLSPRQRQYVLAVQDEILAEVNVKQIEFIDDSSGLVVKKAKPNFPVLAQKGLGKHMKAIQAFLGQMDTAAIFQLAAEGSVAVPNGAEPISLGLADVLIESSDIAGWATARSGDLVVALDLALTPALRQEGIARDLVNRIQNLRKDKDFDVQDKIHVRLHSASDAVNQAVAAFQAYISQETQARSLQLVADLAGGDELEVDEFKVKIAVEVAELV
jgi:isoleucyl-tRNA synthetase